MPGLARRQMRRRAVVGGAVAASAVSSARTNRAVRKNIEGQNDQQQASQAPADNAGAAADNSVESQLSELKSLFDKSLITEEEYAAKKSAILGL